MRESRSVLMIILGIFLVATGWMLPDTITGYPVVRAIMLSAGFILVVYALYSLIKKLLRDRPEVK